MDDRWEALGLVGGLEGVLYALFPQAMIDMMRKLPDVPPATLRLMGIVAVALGWLLVKWVRS